MEVCRCPLDPFIYHGLSVNARLTLIRRAQRSIGRIGRAGGLGGRPAPQTTLPVGIFSDSIVSANCSNSAGVNTYDAYGFISLPPLLLCAVNHKCLRMFRLCISLLTFTISLIPEIVFKKFFAKFISQCITSNVYRISSFCKQKHLNKIE
jgi:hypothetical protein